MSAISSLFNHLIDQQVGKVNVAKGLKRVPVNASRVEAKVLTSDVVRSLLNSPDVSKLQSEGQGHFPLYIKVSGINTAYSLLHPLWMDLIAVNNIKEAR